MKKIVAWVFVLAVVVALVAMRVRNSGEENPTRSIEQIHAEEGVPVDVATVREGTVTVTREIVGEVVGYRHSVLRASGDYKVAGVQASEGQKVRRGDRLLSYDVGVAPDNLARLAQAREAYENARRQVARLEPLFQEGAVAESDLDAARTQLAIAEADLRNARLEIEVVSPIDGVVTAVAVRSGDVVESGDVIAQVAVLDSVRVEARVGAGSAGELRLGAPVTVLARGTQEIAGLGGRVSRVALAADPDTRLFAAEATLRNPNGTLRPGQIVTLAVVVDQVAGVAVLPLSAVLGDEAARSGDTCAVYVVRDGVARRTVVSAGSVADVALEARAGVEVGDRVVVFGANRLADGVKTRLHRVDGELVDPAAQLGEGAR